MADISVCIVISCSRSRRRLTDMEALKGRRSSTEAIS
jgi:hypothetical protein